MKVFSYILNKMKNMTQSCTETTEFASVFLCEPSVNLCVTKKSGKESNYVSTR
jgi:hypothetical protein